MTKIEKLEKKLEAKTGKVIISPGLIRPKTKIDFKKVAKIAEEIRKLEDKELKKIDFKYDCTR